MPIHGLPPTNSPSYPPHFSIENVIRPNILALHPYRCARDDYTEGILLDANENALGHAIVSTSSSTSAQKSRSNGTNTKPTNGDAAAPTNIDTGANVDFETLDLHRYPDPAQRTIKTRIAELRNVKEKETGRPKDECVFLGVGSDEVLDMLMRVCVKPGREKILVTPPTYGMYAVCAQVNDLEVVKVPLLVEGGAFQLDVPAIKRAIDADPLIKLIFLCSPGNPTGTLISLSDIKALLEYENFHGIVVVDEAYIDFSPPGSSAVALVDTYANLCVSQTLSKSFGLAGIRLGIAIAQPPLIQVLSNTKAPYNIASPSAALALAALSPPSLSLMRTQIAELASQRARLLTALAAPELRALGLGEVIGGNHANFVLVPVLAKPPAQRPGVGVAGDSEGITVGLKPDNKRSEAVYKELAEREGVVVRFRGREFGCEGCLRITVGSEEENEVLLRKLKEVLERV